MKLCTLTAFWILLLLAPVAASAQDAVIDQKVSAALALAKKNDQSAVYDLCKSYGERILPYFRHYITDKNDDVRWAVETAAAQFSSPQAKEMLVQLVRDQEATVADHALRSFVRLFPPAELSEVDGKRLNDGLLIRVKRGDASSRSLLLLLTFRRPPRPWRFSTACIQKAQERWDWKIPCPWSKTPFWMSL